MAAVGDVRRSEAEEVRRAAILPEDAIARLMKPIRSGQSAAWCAAAGLTGFGAAPLLQAPGWAWPSLAAGAAGAAGQVARGRRLRERQVVAIGIIGGLSRVIGPRQLDQRTVVLRRWTRGRGSVPTRVDVRYHPGIEAGPAWRAEVLRIVAARTGRPYEVAAAHPRRRLLRLRLTTASSAAVAASREQVRLERAVNELMGATAKTGEIVLSEEGKISAFQVRHEAGAKLATRGYRIRVERTLGTMLPGRWRAHWDLEGDTVQFELRPALPNEVWMPVPPPTDAVDLRVNYRAVQVPYAVDEDGMVMSWRPGVVPHFLIIGPTGMGKTSTSRAVIAGITSNGWPMWIADVKRVEFRDTRDWPNVQVVASSIPQIVAMIHQAWQVMMDRYELVEQGKAKPSDFEPLVVLIDEYTEFINMLRSWYARVKVKGDSSVPPTLDEVASLLRLGRTGRVHLVMTAQRPDIALFGSGEMRDNLGQRASLGRLSPKGAEMMWESASVGVSIPRGKVGRMTTTNDDGHPVEAQAYRFPDLDVPDDSDQGRLLSALRPGTAVHDRLLILGPEPPDEGSLTWHHYANTRWCRAVDRPDQDPLKQVVDDDFDPVAAGSPLGVLGLTGSSPAADGGDQPGTHIPVPTTRVSPTQGTPTTMTTSSCCSRRPDSSSPASTPPRRCCNGNCESDTPRPARSWRNSRTRASSARRTSRSPVRSCPRPTTSRRP